MERQKIITAPFTPEQVETLNLFQRSGVWHPFTCGGNIHTGGSPELIATKAGWRCPQEDCDYTQDWAHTFMANRPFLESQLRILQNH